MEGLSTMQISTRAIGAMQLFALALVATANANDSTSSSISTEINPAAKLTCKNIPKSRWQLCGDIKPFKKFVVGVGVRFAKINPDGRLDLFGDIHTDCESLASDSSVQKDIRQLAARECRETGFERSRTQILQVEPSNSP
jgi:hypothetical protein